MTVFAVTMVKDERDIIEHTIGAMLDQVDEVIVADNGSTDGTYELLQEIACKVGGLYVRQDPEVGYYQSAKMSRLAAQACELGAEWVIPFDADERWYSPHGRIADVLSGRPEAIGMAALYDHVPTAEDGMDPDPLKRIGWRRREPAPLCKVACRPCLPVTIEQGNHGAGYVTDRVDGLLVVRHFPTRSPEQMVRKARNGGAAYAATNLPEHVGAHWRQWNELSDEQLGDVFREYYHSAFPQNDDSLIFDPAP